MGLYVQQSRKRVFQGICVLAIVASLVAPSLYGLTSSRVARADDMPASQADTESPVISMHKNSPKNGSIIDGDKVSSNTQENRFLFIITEGDSGAGVESAVMTMTNRKTNVATDFNLTQNNNNKRNWDVRLASTKQFSDGTYDITVKATDADGNQGLFSGRNVIVDNNAPVATIVSPTANAYLHNIVKVTGQTDVPANDHYSFVVKDKNGTIVASSGSINSPVWNWDTTAPIALNGAYTIAFEGVDKVGGSSNSAEVTVTVDNTTPSTPTINTIDSNTNPSRTITGTAEPNTTVTVGLDTGASQNVPVDTNGNWSAVFDALGVQSYTATAYVADKADNHSATATASFEVQELVVLPPSNTGTPTGTNTDTDDYKLEIKPEIIVKGLIEPNQTNRSFNYGFNVSDQTDDSLGASSLLADNKGDQEVKGESIFGNNAASTAAVTSSAQGWKVLGIAWYWWIAVLLVVCLGVWQLSTSIYRRLQKQEI